MERLDSIRKLKEIKPDLATRFNLSSLRVFDPSVVGDANNIGVLVVFRQTPSLFDVSALQSDLITQLGVDVSLAVEGMIQPHFLELIHSCASEV